MVVGVGDKVVPRILYAVELLDPRQSNSTFSLYPVNKYPWKGMTEKLMFSKAAYAKKIPIIK